MAITIFLIVALIFSAVCHEYAHGWVAYKLGDNTAKDAGRLTLNPIAHLDPIGSILLPFFLILSGSKFLIGWAKPVPYNPHNLLDQKYGDLKVALGGPATNLMLAIIFGIVARLTPLAVDIKISLINNFLQGDNNAVLGQLSGNPPASLFALSAIVVFINLLLMIFNLIPIPPLDGSKVLMAFLPTNWKIKMYQIEPFGIFIVFFLLMLGVFSVIWPLVFYLFTFLIGLS